MLYLNVKRLNNTMRLHALVIALIIAYNIHLYANYFSWDFMTYWMSGRYLFGQRDYFSLLASPGLPLLIGWIPDYNLAWMFLIALSSFVLWISARTFAVRYRVNEFLFLSALAFPAYLRYGMSNGTEMLSYSMLLLWLATKDGIFLGASSLLRHGNIIFFLVPISRMDFRSVLRGSAVLVISLVVSYAVTGDAFSIFLNQSMQEKDYSVMHPLIVAAAMLVFLIGWMRENYVVQITGLSLLQYGTAPILNLRYLFFTSIGVGYLFARRKMKFAALLSLALGMGYLLSSLSIVPYERAYIYYGFDGMRKVCSSLNVPENCTVLSDQWMHAWFCGIKAYPLTESLMNSSYARIVWPEYVPGECFPETPVVGYVK